MPASERPVPELVLRAGCAGTKTDEGREAQVDLPAVQAAGETVNRALQMAGHNLQFRVHEASGRVQVKVVEASSGKVVREIPPTQLLDLSASIKRMLEQVRHSVGVLVDESI
jgi:flagellar protein FlaG